MNDYEVTYGVDLDDFESAQDAATQARNLIVSGESAVFVVRDKGSGATTTVDLSTS